MKTKAISTFCMLFTLACSLSLFYACNDETDNFYLFEYWEVRYDPEPPISETIVRITGGKSLGIAGGTAPYTAETTDGQIATAYIDEDNDIYISSIKLGSTSLIVKDADGRTIEIGVKVVNDKRSFSIQSVEARITGIDENSLDEQQQEKLEAIIEKVKTDADMKAGGGIVFSYDQKSSGEATMVTDKDNGQAIKGSFSYSSSDATFHIKADGGKEYTYKPTSPESPDASTRDLGPSSYWLVEDVTEKYKPDVAGLPGTDAASLKIERIYIGMLSLRQ